MNGRRGHTMRHHQHPDVGLIMIAQPQRIFVHPAKKRSYLADACRAMFVRGQHEDPRGAFQWDVLTPRRVVLPPTCRRPSSSARIALTTFRTICELRKFSGF
ncbi:hypothetical protein ACVIKO_006555 [Rhizobium ruizarguesonis]